MYGPILLILLMAAKHMLIHRKGWTRLADKLARDPLTRKGRIRDPRMEEYTDSLYADTIFYKTWIEPNNDPSFATNLTGQSSLISLSEQKLTKDSLFKC